MAAMIFLLMMISPANADQRNFKPSDFFDWGYALHLWNDLKTREQLEAEAARVDPYLEPWKEKYKNNPAAGQEALKTHPQAELIKQGLDLERVYQQWTHAYKRWRPGIQWNDCGLRTPFIPPARSIVFRNIFTHCCNDLPDWRTDSARAWDEENVKKQRWLSEERATSLRGDWPRCVAK